MESNPVKLFGSSVEFATFGKNSIAYVRPVRSDDMNARFPMDEDLPKGLDLWGLFNADGTPIALADDKTDLMSNAEEMELLAVQTQ